MTNAESPQSEAAQAGTQSEALSNLMHEERRFEPPADLAANANVKADAYERPRPTSRGSGPSRPSG